MTWIKTVPISESDEKLRRAMEARALSERVCCANSSDAGWPEFGHRRIAQPDSQRSLSRVCHVWIIDVAGVAVDQRAARDDYDRRLSRQSLSLLNRISRRVSASRYPG